MKFDLSAMTQRQLTGLIAKAKQRKMDLEKEAIAKMRKKVQTMIESKGLTLSEVIEALRTPSRRGVHAVRVRQSK